MNEIYWITRLDGINTLSVTLFALFLIVTIGFMVAYLSMSYECLDRYKNELAVTKKVLKCSIPISIISLLSMIFVPTTEEAYMIYGVGGAVDYLKTNKTARKLPDKVISALDAWVDSKIGANKKEEK